MYGLAEILKTSGSTVVWNNFGIWFKYVHTPRSVILFFKTISVTLQTINSEIKVLVKWGILFYKLVPPPHKTTYKKICSAIIIKTVHYY